MIKTWHPRVEVALHENTSHFFRDYLQYKESKAFKVVSENNTKELYAIFKGYVKRTFGSDKKAFIEDICRYVPWYLWIIESNPATVISKNQDINNVLIELLRNIFHDIKAEAFKPLVLGLLEYHQKGFNGENLSDAQLKEALLVIRTYLMRRRVLKLNQGENKDVVRLCEEIRNSQQLLDDANTEMLKMLSNGGYNLRLPNDGEVAKELARIDFYNGLIKYRKLILGKIEEQISKVSVDFRNPEITVEHIMPQEIKSSESWIAEIGDDWEEVHKTYLHNIDNLILTEFNSEMGNKPLEKKKEKLQNSNLSYRSDVINRYTWNKRDIESHQSEMISRFLATFPLPSHMQRTDNWDTKQVAKAQDLFSPLDKDSTNNATGRKPNAFSLMMNYMRQRAGRMYILCFCGG